MKYKRTSTAFLSDMNKSFDKIDKGDKKTLEYRDNFHYWVGALDIIQIYDSDCRKKKNYILEKIRERAAIKKKKGYCFK